MQKKGRQKTDRFSGQPSTNNSHSSKSLRPKAKKRSIVRGRGGEQAEMATKRGKMFPIEHVIQFDLEHGRDWVRALLGIEHGKVEGQVKRTFAGANLAHSRRGIAKTILYTMK